MTTPTEFIPLLRLNPSDDSSKKTKIKKKPKNVGPSMLPTFIASGILSFALVGFLTFVALKEPARAYKPRAFSPMSISGSVRKFQPKKTQRTTETITIAEARMRLTNAVRKDVLNLAPGVYVGVKLVFSDGAKLVFSDKIDVSKRIDAVSKSAKHQKVEYVEISVAAQPWNRLKSDKKINLLYNTFNLMQTHYPGLSEYIHVTFDDNRQALDLKFDTFKKMLKKS